MGKQRILQQHVRLTALLKGLIKQHCKANKTLMFFVFKMVSVIATTMAFASPVKATQTQGNIPLNNQSASQQPSFYQTEDNQQAYKGELISMQFHDVAVRSALDILAGFANTNIVASDAVTGRMTVRLVNVPWDQALDIILKNQNLAMHKQDGVIFVSSKQELATQQAAELQAQQMLDTVLPLQTKYIRLNYAKANDIYALIMQSQNKSLQSSNINNASATNVSNQNSSPSVKYPSYQNSLLSNRGVITIDERTNTLIVKDVALSIANIEALIKQIDIPVKQVMIEARIVSATDSFSRELGINWSLLSQGVSTNNDLLVGGSQQTLWDLKTPTANGYNIRRPDNLNVDLGVANAAGRIAFGLVNLSDLTIDLELSAMQAEGRGEVISTPKILTADKQTAKVVSGTQIPYQEVTTSGATATKFIEASLSLEVTPNITPDGKIGMRLNINNDSPRQLSTGSYAIDTNSISTNVLVENGQTVVLGGVYRTVSSNAQNKVPVLGELPLFGNLFKRQINSNNKEELLIFVTPKLLSQ